MSSRPPRERIAIQKGRFEAFSDGVFAIAITLLVLELRPPDQVANDGALIGKLLGLWPEYLVFVASFATIGIMWFNHYALFHNVRSVSYTALIANLALLLGVCFLPFTTLLLGRVGLMPSATAFYGLTLLAISLCFNVLWYAASVPPGEHGNVIDFLRKRNAWNSIGLIVYAAGSALAFVNPLLSILLFVAMAAYYLLPSTVRAALAAAEQLADDARRP
jgi:TMEM175 potassium channel family protein